MHGSTMIRLAILVLLIAGCVAPLSQVPPSGMPDTIPAPEILKTRCVMTVINGEIVFAADSTD